MAEAFNAFTALSKFTGQSFDRHSDKLEGVLQVGGARRSKAWKAGYDPQLASLRHEPLFAANTNWLEREFLIYSHTVSKQPFRPIYIDDKQERHSQEPWPHNILFRGTSVVQISEELFAKVREHVEQEGQKPYKTIFEALHIQPRAHSEMALETNSLHPAIQLVSGLEETWDLSDQEVAVLIGFKKAGHLKELFLKHAILLESTDLKRRLYFLLEIRAALKGLFDDKEREKEWMRERNALFQGRSPLSVMLEGQLFHIENVRNAIFGALDHGYPIGSDAEL